MSQAHNTTSLNDQNKVTSLETITMEHKFIEVTCVLLRKIVQITFLH